MDPRNEKLASGLVHHSCRLQKNEKILIECTGVEAIPLVDCVVKEVFRSGGLPFVNIYSETTQRELLLGASEARYGSLTGRDRTFMEQMDAFIGISAPENTNEYNDVPQENMNLHEKLYKKPVHSDVRVKKTKWVILRYPTAATAQHFGSSKEAYADFYYKVCNLDYGRMLQAMRPLKELMERTDTVHIIGPGTDLSFSVKGVPAVPCAGELNIPDGEIFTAPVRDSVNGTLRFNTGSDFQGFHYRDISFRFKDGKIVEASANDTERLNKVLDTDAGARYAGEFALGVNPYITRPMNSTLFDEKIMGSFHFTPGNCYDEAPNGNESAIHWDLVCIQTAEWGGGEIWFDGELVRKDGLFVPDKLKVLNPENLAG
ncbi:MAG: aminopeptidase [Firmicutes bacterium]|nr:aminopeptidase [Bacillota bacterium]